MGDDDIHAGSEASRRRVELRRLEADAALAPPSALQSAGGALLQRIAEEVPFAGPVIARLLDLEGARMEDALKSTISASVAESERIDRRFAEGDRALPTFVTRVIVESARSENDGKIALYVALIHGVAAPDGPDDELRLRLLDALNYVRPRHLRLLADIATGEWTRFVAGQLPTYVSVYGLDPDDFEWDYRELRRVGLVGIGNGYGGDTFEGMTQFGREFHAFLISQAGTSRGD